MNEWYVGVLAALLVLAVVSLAVALVRERARTRAELAAAYAVVAGLNERLDDLERRRAEPAAEASAFVITDVASTGSTTDTESHLDHRIDGSLFADLVLRESLVKGASFAYGLRRALAPESRNRIRFLMRQEVRRSRKQRKADLRAARRFLSDRQRAESAA